MMLILMISMFYGLSLHAAFKNIARSVVDVALLYAVPLMYERATSYDAQKVRPDLYQAFDQIRKDAGIDKKLSLRIMTPYSLMYNTLKGSPGSYNGSPGLSNTVFIRSDIENNESAVRVFRHELEHYRQAKGYPGSLSLWFDSTKDCEHAADKAAAEYITCYECLQLLAQQAGNSDKGYFSKLDYEPYIKKALKAKALCYAHAHPIKNEKISEEDIRIAQYFGQNPLHNISVFSDSVLHYLPTYLHLQNDVLVSS